MSQLSPEDGRAIDAILMNGNSNSGMPATAAEGILMARISTAAKVLNLLDAMPKEEPPKGLADRTIEFVKNSQRPRGENQPQFADQPGR